MSENLFTLALNIVFMSTNAMILIATINDKLQHSTCLKNEAIAPAYSESLYTSLIFLTITSEM